MHFKKGILSTALSLSLLMPSFAFADANSTFMQSGRNLNNFSTISDTRMMLGDDSQDVKSKLTPETKAKFKELNIKLKNNEITKEQFHQELKKILPENHHFKHKNKEWYKELSNENKVKLKELKTKLNNGEITKDQFKQEIKQILPQK